MWETGVQSLGQEDSPGEGNGNLLQYSCLEIPTDRGGWYARVYGVTESWTRLSDFTFFFTLIQTHTHTHTHTCIYDLYMGFPCGSAGKEAACNVGDLGSIPGLGRSPGKGQGYQLQYSGLENSMDSIVHGVAKSRTWLSDFHSHTCINIISPPFLFSYFF